MERSTFFVKTRSLQADTYTPVGIYLRLRDAFPQSLLLECSDYSSRHDSFSYICLKPVLGLESDGVQMRMRNADGHTQCVDLNQDMQVADLVDKFLGNISLDNHTDTNVLPGLFGYTAYDAVSLFDRVGIENPGQCGDNIPLLKYDLYQIVIAFNHFNNTLSVAELVADNLSEETPRVLSLLANRNATSFPFMTRGQEVSPITDEDFMESVRHGIRHCARGDVFQIVLSRRFEQAFSGDEFNVYRAVRSINPSPYLFYFDYLNFKLFGSSPESQLRIHENRITINPIAGTVIRTGHPEEDARLIADLLENKKENAEHCMLVDLARNDLSKHASQVRVDTFREVHTYSHVLHLVSKVSGVVPGNDRNYRLFADTFPAGTLSGAPKFRAIQLIDDYEKTARGFYGGGIGILGLNGSLNHAIMIRSFLSKTGKLIYQAGAGVVIESSPEGELKEVNGKISALRKAIKLAESFSTP